MGIFDKMAETIGSASKDVAKKAKDVSEAAKCTTEIEERQRRLQGIYSEIGKYLWENHEENMGEPYEGWFSEIVENRNIIRELEEKRRILKRIVVCPNCGAELRKDANFCNECGIRVDNEASTRRCAICGSELKENQIFCVKCGVKVEQLSVEMKTPVKKIICRNCGRELRAEYAFCQYCGMAVNGNTDKNMDLDVNS